MNEPPSHPLPVKDALGRTILGSGDVRVHLDDELDDRRAPEGWVHVISAREVCFLLLTGRVVELSLDNDLGDEGPEEYRFGVGFQVIDFLEDQHGTYGRSLWPRDGIRLHTANAGARKRMERCFEGLERRLPVTVEKRFEANNQPKYVVVSKDVCA